MHESEKMLVVPQWNVPFAIFHILKLENPQLAMQTSQAMMLPYWDDLTTELVAPPKHQKKNKSVKPSVPNALRFGRG